MKYVTVRDQFNKKVKQEEERRRAIMGFNENKNKFL